MKLRKLVVVVAVAALGSLAVASMVRADDADGDGVRNSKGSMRQFGSHSYRCHWLMQHRCSECCGQEVQV